MPAGPVLAGPMAQYAGTGQARAAGPARLMRLAGQVRPGRAPVAAVGLPGAVGQRGGSAGLRTGPEAGARPAGAVVPELAGPTDSAVATGAAVLTKRGVRTGPAALRRRVAQLDRGRAATSPDGRPGLGKRDQAAQRLGGPGTRATPRARAAGPVAGRGPRRAGPPVPDPGQAGARADTRRGLDSRQATHERGRVGRLMVGLPGLGSRRAARDRALGGRSVARQPGRAGRRAPPDHELGGRRMSPVGGRAGQLRPGDRGLGSRRADRGAGRAGRPGAPGLAFRRGRPGQAMRLGRGWRFHRRSPRTSSTRRPRRSCARCPRTWLRR